MRASASEGEVAEATPWAQALAEHHGKVAEGEVGGQANRTSAVRRAGRNGGVIKKTARLNATGKRW